MTERDFENIADFAQDQLAKSTKHRFEGRGIKIHFFSDDHGIVEIRYYKKPIPTLEDL